jgi:hypothetical protein
MQAFIILPLCNLWLKPEVFLVAIAVEPETMHASSA